MAAQVGISIAEAMRLPSLAGARVIAGASRTDRVITSVNMMEVPDIDPYVRKGELLVTTAYPLRDDAGALATLVPLLTGKGLAGMALKPGRYIDAPPAAMLAASDRLGFPLIELAPDASFNDVLADVLGTILNRQALRLERSSAVHDRLSAVVARGGSYAELIRTLADLVQRPATLLDAHDQVLATSPAGAGEHGEEARAVRPIQVGATRQGKLILWSAGDGSGPGGLPPDATAALDHAATIAAMLMAQARSVAGREQRYRAVLLQELVSGHTVDREDFAEAAATFGWNLSLPRAAVIVELRRRGRAGAVTIAGQTLEERLLHAVRRGLGPEAIAWGLRRGMAVLAPVDAEDAGAAARAGEALRRAIRAAQPEMEVSVAIGRVYAETADLARSYREAGQAMAVGRDVHSGGFVLGYDELGLYRLLHGLPSAELARYCEETLGPLLDYDRRHGGPLVQTLEAYLRHGGNMASAARELYVHYNTMRYRMGLIESLVGGLERYAAERVSLEVALHARRLLQARRRTP